MARKLGQLEALLFAYVQLRKLQVLGTGDLVGPLHISPKQERELLGRMARSRIIAQVRRGLYLVPLRLPLGGTWSPDEALALSTLMDDQNGRYQICGPNAFNRYGYDEQIPNRIYAYNNRLSGDRRIGSLELTLIKVSDDRLGDTERVGTADGKAIYSSRVRTLLDAVYDWSRFGGLPRGYRWIATELKSARVTPAELIACTLRYGNQGTIRRIGVLLEREGVKRGKLKELHAALNSSKSLVPWIPADPTAGRWIEDGG